MMRTAFSALFAAGLATALLTVSTLSADARGHGFGGHGSGHGLGGHATMHGAEFGGDRRHGNHTYVNASSEERDRLLDKEIKSICRGC
jgi:hypothetical protein